MPPILASTVATSSPGAITFANNLRIASIAVAVYEYVAGGRFLLALVLTQYSDSYIITLPSEYRLYKTSSRRR
jgi:hypothetical protein